ncbi:MAG TPA: hypothetical protein DIW31_01870 [Bacteroidales bacterium]|nr:hypothetical protein [Bacteroidales bacterium]
MKYNKLITFLVFLFLIPLALLSQNFKTIKIGDKVWMAENLNIEVPGSWCYDNNPDKCKKYGRLYTYEAAIKNCPKGWHLPTDEEWTQLINKLGGEEVAGKEMKISGSSGFNALLGGSRIPMGSFGLMDTYGCFWSSTKYDKTHAWYRYITNQNDYIIRTYFTTTYGFSVRYVKD